MGSKHAFLGKCARHLSLALLGVVVAGCADDKADSAAGAGQMPPAQVKVVEVAPRTVTLERVYPARAQAADDVEVRARVQGTLLKRSYDEGRQVKSGTVLFRIDPATFEAQVQRAEAELARAQAQLRQAEREWARTEALFKDNAVSARQRDEALSALELAKAAVATAVALLKDARIQLAYTEVKAPISGVTGLRAVSEGNLIQPGALLTTIRQLDPLHVLFAMPEADALAQRQRADGRELPATLLLPDGSTYAHPGRIDFTASAVDPRTGTVQARAVFPNPDNTLLPGQFVRVSVGGLEIPNQIVVPGKAVAQSPRGPVVYVVDENDTAQPVTVKLGQSLQAGQVIEEGLQGGERVIFDGLIGVQPGAKVAPMLAESESESAAPTAAAPGAAQ